MLRRNNNGEAIIMLENLIKEVSMNGWSYTKSEFDTGEFAFCLQSVLA